MTRALLHFVKCDFGKGGVAFIERDIADMDLETTVADIASGQIDNVLAVYETCEEGPIFRDVTEDIAKAVMAVWADEDQPLQDWQHSFVELFVSVTAANSFRRAA